MGRSKSRRSRRGGDNQQLMGRIQNLETLISEAQVDLNNLKQDIAATPMMPEAAPMMPAPEPMMPEAAPMMPAPEPMMPAAAPMMAPTINKSWQTNKDIKFRDGAGGRVSLSFPRIMTLIDQNKNAPRTNGRTGMWSEIKSELINANSLNEVQDVINKYKLSFTSNYVSGGTRKRRRNKKKCTSKRR